MSLVVLVIIVIVLAFLMYAFPIIQVCGVSMSPTYLDGEFILGIKVFRVSNLKVGDVVVYKCPHDGQIVIKRIGKIIDLCNYRGKFTGTDLEDKKVFYCYGDNPDQSFDSRMYGGVEQGYLICKILHQRKNKYTGGSINE